MRKIKETMVQVLSIERDSIHSIISNLNMKQVEEVVEMFCECRGKILVSGCGTSGAAAKKIAHTLCCVNKPTVYLNPADAVHGGLGIVTKGDIVVLLSKGGETPEITSLVYACKVKGAATIAITERDSSMLTKSCDVSLQIKVLKEADEFNMLATASTLAVIAVMDAIAICVMERNAFTKEDFGVIHPGGAVGNRLLNKKSL